MSSSPIHLLERFQRQELTLEETLEALQKSQYLEIQGHTRLDTQRKERTGVAEIIYGAGKSAQQLLDITQALAQKKHNILITRLSPESALLLEEHFPLFHYDSLSRLGKLLFMPPKPCSQGKFLAIVSAGTSDMAVAEEAAQTAEFLGHRVERFYDCGVAGLHRLLSVLPQLQQAHVLIAIAGMEGALASVLGGLVKRPVIAVPTSVGYGAHFEGISTLLSMINSCANGISVVNIDNGFGAAYNAHLILQD